METDLEGAHGSRKGIDAVFERCGDKVHYSSLESVFGSEIETSTGKVSRQSTQTRILPSHSPAVGTWNARCTRNEAFSAFALGNWRDPRLSRERARARDFTRNAVCNRPAFGWTNSRSEPTGARPNTGTRTEISNRRGPESGSVRQYRFRCWQRVTSSCAPPLGGGCANPARRLRELE